MTGKKNIGNSDSMCVRLTKFGIGLALILGLVFCLGSGMTPPGVLGEVVRHNERCWVDAAALFYTDVENMQDMEREVAETRAAPGGSIAISRGDD